MPGTTEVYVRASYYQTWRTARQKDLLPGRAEELGKDPHSCKGSSQLCVVWGEFSRPGYNSAMLWGLEQIVTFSALVSPSARSENGTEMA